MGFNFLSLSPTEKENESSTIKSRKRNSTRPQRSISDMTQILQFIDKDIAITLL